MLANIQTALPVIAQHIYGGWDNIQSLHIKTNSSLSLPVWTCSLDEQEGGRWDGFQADENSGSEDEEVAEQGAEKATEEENKKVKKVDKGKKRTSEDDGHEDLAKKQKAAKSTVPSTSKSNAPSKPIVLTAAIASPSKQAATDVDSLPKSKKRKVSVSATANSPTPTKKSLIGTFESPKTVLKGKKQKVDIPVALSTAPTSSEKVGKEKQTKIPDVSLKAVAIKNDSLTHVDLKQKRSQNTGDKKKEKVIKAKGGKSMKDGVLGRKVAQA